MDAIFLRNHNERLNLSEGQLILSAGNKVINCYPICAVEIINVYGNSQITTQAIKECLKEGIRINYFNVYGKFIGKVEPDFPKNIMRRMMQYKLFWDNKKRLEWAKSLIFAKIHGEIIELRKLHEQKYIFPYKEIKNELKFFKNQVMSAENITTLLGIEGMAAKKYYEIFHYVLPENILWQGRSYHPPKDDINAILSMAYGAAAQKIREAIEHAALDPHCSFMHQPGYGKGGLAYDLLEIWRAVFCDHYALNFIYKEKDMFNSRKKISSATKEKLYSFIADKANIQYYCQKSSFHKQINFVMETIKKCLMNSDSVPQFFSVLPER